MVLRRSKAWSALGLALAVLACGSQADLTYAERFSNDPAPAGGQGGAGAPADAGPDAPDAAPDAAAPDATPDAPSGAIGGFSCGWIKTFGNSKEQSQITATVAPSGEIVLGGSFYGAIDLGGGSLASKVVNSDLFLATLSPSGEHLWSKTFSQKGYGAYVIALRVDGAGNIHAAGSYDGTFDFGGGPLESKGQTDMYAVKLGPKGEHLWSVLYGSSGEQNVRNLHLDAAGNVSIWGDYLGEFKAPIGPYKNPSSEHEPYLIRLDAQGKLLGSKTWPIPGGELFATQSDEQGQTLMVGRLSSSSSLGGPTLAVNEPQGQLFLARYDAEGNHLASKVFAGGTKGKRGVLAPLGSGRVAYLSALQGALDLGQGPVKSEGSGATVLLAGLSAQGEPLFVQSAGGGEDKNATAIAAAPSGDLFIGGNFKKVLPLGEPPLTVGSVNAAGFLARVSATGEVRNRLVIGGGGRHQISALAVTPEGDLIVAGAFEGAIDLGKGKFTSAGDADLFVARCTPVD